jgi:hypothetical protein
MNSKVTLSEIPQVEPRIEEILSHLDSSLLDLESESPEPKSSEWIDKNIKKSLSQWNYTSEKRIFWPASAVCQTIPPGLYKTNYSNDIGYHLQKMDIRMDDFLDLPGMVCNDVIEEIKKFWTPEIKQNLLKRGFIYKRGILLYGEPGSGKSASIQRLIGMLIDKGGIAIYGDSAEKMISCLHMIRHIEPTRPIITVLEDFEILTQRTHQENLWLSLLDGEAQIDNIVFLATTNYVEELDKRFTDRPSRFDKVVAVKMPGPEARAVYLKNKEPDMTTEEIIDWVNKTQGFSLAHLKELIVSVKCFGNSMEESVDHLHKMRERNFSNTSLSKEHIVSNFGFMDNDDKSEVILSEENIEKLFEKYIIKKPA